MSCLSTILAWAFNFELVRPFCHDEDEPRLGDNQILSTISFCASLCGHTVKPFIHKAMECFFCGKNPGGLPLETVLGLSFTPSDPLPVRDRSLPQCQGPVKFQTQSRAFFIAKETLPISPWGRRHHRIWQHERFLWKLTLTEQRYNNNPRSSLRLCICRKPAEGPTRVGCDRRGCVKVFFFF